MAKIHLQICFFLPSVVKFSWLDQKGLLVSVKLQKQYIADFLSTLFNQNNQCTCIIGQESISNKAPFTEETNILFLEGRVHCAQRPATYI